MQQQATFSGEPEASLREGEARFPVQAAKDPLAAASFLEALGLLELFGAERILAVSFKNWTQEIHEHTLDEVGHAQTVQEAAKRLRWKMSPQEIVRESKMGQLCYQATQEYLVSLSKRIFLLTKSILENKIIQK
jgi:hypothetical protein